MPSVPVKTKERRSATVRTFGRRGELLACGLRAAGDRALRFSLRRLDPALELLWHPHARKWILYRVTRKGITPSSDCLLEQFILERPPGSWLLDTLRKTDKTRAGSVDPEYADRQAMKRFDDTRRREDEAKAKETGELAKSFALEVAGRRFRDSFTREVTTKDASG